jgi:hypothetical protein
MDGGRGGEKQQTFEALPSSARGFLFPSDRVCEATTSKGLGFKARKA